LTRRRIVFVAAVVSTIELTAGPGTIVTGQEQDQLAQRRGRFSHDASAVDAEIDASDQARWRRPTEAPAGFEGKTNGFDPQGPALESLDKWNVVRLRSYNDNRFIFEEIETLADGLGPTYNAQSCRECHQNIVTGGASQVTVQRAGHLHGGHFFESQGGSLIQSRATYAEATELVPEGDDIRTFRISTNTLGDGYVEAISNATLLRIRDGQPRSVRGTAVIVAVLEASGRSRIGRFGWKAQHASLESFAADAYLNEMGITSPLLPRENTANGADVSRWDPVADPEDDGQDVRAFANFIRSTTVPPRGPVTAVVLSGEQLFQQIGCAMCHVPSVTTAPPHTPINGGTLFVSDALGNKVIHPYSDFLLHDIATGDGIPIQPIEEYAETANRMKTAPLWGLRTRNRLMHDGLSFTREEAILRHGGQAADSTRRYQSLSPAAKATLLAFLNSL
jgi:CxxC motif-containing protein (DUF1111 family)